MQSLFYAVWLTDALITTAEWKIAHGRMRYMQQRHDKMEQNISAQKLLWIMSSVWINKSHFTAITSQLLKFYYFFVRVFSTSIAYTNCETFLYRIKIKTNSANDNECKWSISILNWNSCCISICNNCDFLIKSLGVFDSRPEFILSKKWCENRISLKCQMFYLWRNVPSLRNISFFESWGLKQLRDFEF